MPRTVNVNVTRQRVAYVRGQVDTARAIDADSVRQILDMVDTLLDVVERYQSEQSCTPSKS